MPNEIMLPDRRGRTRRIISAYEKSLRYDGVAPNLMDIRGTVGPEVVNWDPPVAARRKLNTEKTGSGQMPYFWTLLIHFTKDGDPGHFFYCKNHF